jgi:hypothetical protein
MATGDADNSGAAENIAQHAPTSPQAPPNERPAGSALERTLASVKDLDEMIRKGEMVSQQLEEKISFRQGQNPYETVIGKWMASALYLYFLGLFVAAAVLSSGGAGRSEAGLIIVIFLIVATYFLGVVLECSMLVKPLLNRPSSQDRKDDSRPEAALPVPGNGVADLEKGQVCHFSITVVAAGCRGLLKC